MQGDDGKILDTLSRPEASPRGREAWSVCPQSEEAMQGAVASSCIPNLGGPGLTQVVTVQELDSWSPYSLLDFIATTKGEDGRP